MHANSKITCTLSDTQSHSAMALHDSNTGANISKCVCACVHVCVNMYVLTDIAKLLYELLLG